MDSLFREPPGFIIGDEAVNAHMVMKPAIRAARVRFTAELCAKAHDGT